VDCTAAILALTGSEVLGLLLNPIRTVIDRLDRLRETIYRDPGSNVAGYRFLLGWLATRDPDALPAVLEALRRRDADNVAALRAGG